MKYFNSSHKSEPLEKDELSLFLEQLSFQVNSVGVWRSAHKRLANYTINDVEFIFYVQGGSRTTVRGTEYECCTHDFLLLEPRQLYSSVNDGLQETEYYFIHFDVEPLLQLPAFLQCFSGPVTRVQNPDRVARMFQMMQNEVRAHEEGYVSTINALIKLLVIELMRSQTHSGEMPVALPSAKGASELFVDNCIAYISEHLKGDCSVNALSTQFNVSQGYVYKAFMHVLQEAPSKYVTRMRMLRAKSLLLTDLFSIEEVAEEVGYTTLAHFSRVFKENIGSSPLAYKKHSLQQQAELQGRK